MCHTLNLMLYSDYENNTSACEKVDGSWVKKIVCYPVKKYYVRLLNIISVNKNSISDWKICLTIVRKRQASMFQYDSLRKYQQYVRTGKQYISQTGSILCQSVKILCKSAKIICKTGKIFNAKIKQYVIMQDCGRTTAQTKTICIANQQTSVSHTQKKTLVFGCSGPYLSSTHIYWQTTAGRSASGLHTLQSEP